MIVTEKARDTILSIMRTQGLDPDRHFLYLSPPESGREGCALTFAQSREIGKQYKFGDLQVVAALEIDQNLIMDIQEVNGRKGLVFKEGEAHVN